MLKNKVVVAFLAAFVCIAGTGSFAQEGGSYTPKFFEREPGITFYLFQEEAHWRDGVISVEKQGTTECMTAPSALALHFPAVDGPSGFHGMDMAQNLPPSGHGYLATLEAYKGVSFYVKTTGSPVNGHVEVRVEQNDPGKGLDFEVGRSWKRVVVLWEDIEIDPSQVGEWLLCFGLAEGAGRPAGYLVDAMRFIHTTDEEPELAALARKADENDGPFEKPHRPSASACAYNKGGLGNSRAKARNGEPMKWVAYGDSVTVPVQLWNITEAHRPAYAYYRVAASAIEKEYGSKIDIVVNALGGRQLNEDFEGLIATLETERPDVLVMQTGDTIRNYELLMPKVVAKAKEVGTEVLVVIPVYDSSELRTPSFDWLLEYCLRNGVACADSRTYLLGPGKVYWGGIFANGSHPGPVGHRLLGESVAEMFR